MADEDRYRDYDDSGRLTSYGEEKRRLTIAFNEGRSGLTNGAEDTGAVSDAGFDKALYVGGFFIALFAFDHFVPLLPGNPHLGWVWLSLAAIAVVFLVKKFWGVFVVALMLYGGYVIYEHMARPAVSIDEANGR